jgi:mono/diheme cytochrome c family protein
VSIQGKYSFHVGQGSSHLVYLVTVATTLMLFLITFQAQGQSTKVFRAGDAPKIEHGKLIYTSSGCYECHGRVGQGSRLSGARIAPPPIDSAAFIQYVRQPAGQMPPYTSKVLSDAELSDIFMFLKSMPAPVAAKDIPLLK